jgi:3D (Asp-Asp-Asp) domain-containing protein
MTTALPCRLVIASACIALVTGCDGRKSTTTAGAPDGVPAVAGDGRLARASTSDSGGLWRELTDGAQSQAILGARGYRKYAVDRERLERALAAAPQEGSGAGGASITLPLPDGTFTRVRLHRSPILSPELQAQHPEMQTYVVQGVDDPTMTGRLARIPAGFHAMLLSNRGAAVITPGDGSEGNHISRWGQAGAGRRFACGVTESEALPAVAPITAAPPDATFAPQASLAPAPLSYGSKLRTYRLALNSDAEFTSYVGGEAQAMAQFVTTTNDLNGFYEREVAIRFQLVYAKAYTDPATDPFTDGSVAAMLVENQKDLDAKVGSANYDLGHLFFMFGEYGGQGKGKVCAPSSKGQGASTGAIALPLGTAFAVDLVGHEIGHMLGATHTFSAGSALGQFTAATAYEVGEGCSVMSYDSLCGGLAEDQGAVYYFHAASFDQITAFANAQGCGVLTDTGNQPPWIQGEPDCTAPRSTPLILRSWGGDPDNDCEVDPAGCPSTHQHEELTYIWEQMDAAPEPVDGYPSPTATTGPLVLSWVPLPPGLDRSERFVPSLKSILEDTPNPWEVLPAVDRTLHFRATVRDNRAGGGGIASVSTRVNIAGAPLRITSPAKDRVVECGEDLTVLWDPGGSAAPSMDVGFETYDPDWSSGLWVGTGANNGSFAFRPWTATTHARVTLAPNPTSCYLAYSEKFSVVDTKPPTITAPDVTAECTSSAGTKVDLGKATAMDACDKQVEAITIADTPSLFPLGKTSVVWEGQDRSGNVGFGYQKVVVHDTTPPVLVAPSDVSVECASPAGTAVVLGNPTVSDACDASVVATNDAPSLFPLGSTTVHWTAVDASGNKSAAKSNLVTVKDTTAPALACNAPASITPSSVPAAFTGTAKDVCKGSLPVAITNYDCYKLNKQGKRSTIQCAVQIKGGTFTIVDSGGIGASIDWDISSADGSGNPTTVKCHVDVVQKK